MYSTGENEVSQCKQKSTKNEEANSKREGYRLACVPGRFPWPVLYVWLKHFSPIQMYREVAAVGLGSSSPCRASVSQAIVTQWLDGLGSACHERIHMISV